MLLLSVNYHMDRIGPRAHYAGVSRVRRFRPPPRRQTIAETPPHTSIPSRRRSNGRGGCRSPVRARYGVFWCILHASGAVQEIFCSGRCNPSLPALRASADAHGSWASATASEKKFIRQEASDFGLPLRRGGDAPWFFVGRPFTRVFSARKLGKLE